MAERRMFAKKITNGDTFTSLPPTTQALYFHLCMNADDDGFSNQIRNAMFNAHADANDFNLLVQHRFILPFENGVIVIKHWRIHNVIRNDRYHETEFLEEKAKIVLKDNGAYTERQPSGNQMATIGIPSDNQMETEVRLGKVSIVKSKNTIGDFEESPDAIFETVWKAYPKKLGKGQVSRTQKARLAKIGTDELLRAVERYKRSVSGKNIQYVMNGSTFFNSGYVDFLDSNYSDSQSSFDGNENTEDWV